MPTTADRLLRCWQVRMSVACTVAALGLGLAHPGHAQEASGEGGQAATGSGSGAAADGEATATPTPAPSGEPNAAAATGEAPPQRSGLTRELAEQGEKDLFESVRVFQQRFLMKSRRLELLAGGGLTMADPMLNHYGVDGGLLYHINEKWAVGVAGSKWFGVRKAQFLQIQRDFGLFPEKSILQAGGHIEAQYSPIVGKFSSFGLTVAQVDAYLVFGGGAARTTRGEDLKPYGMIGVGARIHTTRWLTVSLELRDMLMREEFLNGPSLLQHVFGGIKLGFWIPPSVTYQYAR